MYVIRPVEKKDLNTLAELAQKAGPGITALPKNRKSLKEKIARSLSSFDKDGVFSKRGLYFFVLEKRGRLGGTCSIYSKTGINEPLYFYRLEAERHPSTTIPLLRAVSLTKGPAELAGLYLDPAWRKKGLGKFLSLSRLLFIAEHRRRFGSLIISRLRGSLDRKSKKFPFWEGVGKKFLDMEIETVWSKMESSRSFIERFLPQYPIYIPLLPPKIQNCIGAVSPNSAPALAILRGQNFKIVPEIDILDGGPTVACPVKDLRAIKLSATAKVVALKEKLPVSREYIISVGGLSGFRAVLAPIKKVGERGIALEKSATAFLNIKEGDSVRYYRL